ncbi:cytidine deaminase-like [Mya arenaria]|uniref:cytidine deaminase-like n=1 Tax=Mya arenaria TaxID=6604 RepID=UPI0022E20C14|nr:cytidine deaminase-like [Mya arenaria]
MDETIIKELISKSVSAKKHAYCKYSNFPVGAALLCEDGTIYTGCNIENVAYSSICAEQTAIAKAVSEGHTKFKAIAVSSNQTENVISPCGPCRQYLVEFGGDWDVIMTKPDMTYTMMKTSELLPLGFVQNPFLPTAKK